MNDQSVTIVSNVYLANLLFNEPIYDFDFFKVEGIASELDRFKLLGRAVEEVQYREKKSFAQYAPSRDENYVVGYLRNGPSSKEFDTESNLHVVYIGKRELPPTASGRRTLTQLLNRSKARELRKTLWSAGAHSFFPKEGLDLNQIQKYRTPNLKMFRGPFYRYNVLSNHKIVMSIDSKTHYVSSVPFIQEIRSWGGLDWFSSEIKKQLALSKPHHRKFGGVHFFYDLAKGDFAITDIDKRPISEIQLPEPQIRNGVECRTVAEYLKVVYRGYPQIAHLDESQPGLKGGSFTFAPQFLFRTVHLEEIPNRILNEQTFFMDDAPARYRNDQKPAQERWRIIDDYYNRYGFQYADLGPRQVKLDGPLEFETKNHFEPPELIAGNREPIHPDQIEFALTNGMFKSPQIENMCIYSLANPGLTANFYQELINYAKDKFGVRLPKQFITLEKDLQKTKIQLGKHVITVGNKIDTSFCLGIIPEASNLHHQFTNACGKLKLRSKCVTIPVVEAVCLDGRRSQLKGTLSSILTRANGIPWILSDELHYGCYAAVDVGRAESQNWAMSVVYQKSGMYTVSQGDVTMTTGESLDEDSVKYCISEANSYAPSSDSLVYLRDGDVFDTERQIFENAIAAYPGYSNVAIVSLKKSVPYRIFRKLGPRIVKPLSGDYYFLDEFNAVLCAAGGDAYKHGTPKPVVAEVIPIRGKIDPALAIEDCFRLCYLDWSNPGKSYSIPAPIRLAHELAAELSSGVSRYGAPF